MDQSESPMTWSVAATPDHGGGATRRRKPARSAVGRHGIAITEMEDEGKTSNCSAAACVSLQKLPGTISFLTKEWTEDI
jgi:hypothetical protein